MRRRLGEAFLAVFFVLTPTSVPQWRSDPTQRVVAVLAVGDPTPSLAVRPAPSSDAGG